MAKIIFFGTTELSARVLQALHSDFDVCLVITQPDRPVGRKQILTESAVSIEAKKLNLELFKPEKLKTDEVLQKIQACEPDLFVVVAYGKIIPQAMLDVPAKGAINIHGSLLPKYRGASPIHAALLNGDSETGISIMLMDEQMDHGPVLKKFPVEIDPDDDFTKLENKLAELSAQNILKILNEYLIGSLEAKIQDETQATYTKILTKEDGKIDWSETSSEIYNKYRAFSKWPGIWCVHEDKILKLTKIAIGPNMNLSPGEFVIHKGQLYVGTLGGSILISELQPEGKIPMSGEDFVRGHKLKEV